MLPSIEDITSTEHDLLFIGTSAGRLLKLTTSSHMIHAVGQVLPHQPITQIAVIAKGARLVVVGADAVRVLPASYCVRAASCAACVALRDVQCAWHAREERCVQWAKKAKDAGGER